MSTQLWKLLIKLREKESLSCGECFALLELLAQAADLGVDLYRLKRLTHQHLKLCPDCRETMWEQLWKLEQLET